MKNQNRVQAANGSLIGKCRQSGPVMKVVAWTVTLTFGVMTTSPVLAGGIRPEHASQASAPVPLSVKASHHSGIADTLEQMRELLTQVPTSASAAKTQAAHASEQGTSMEATRRKLMTLREQLAAQGKTIETQFAAVRQHVRSHHLPQKILDRATKAEANYKSHMSALTAQIDAAEAAHDHATFRQHARDIKGALDRYLKRENRTQFDPKRLPNRGLAPDRNRKPYTTREQFASATTDSSTTTAVTTAATTTTATMTVRTASLSRSFDISNMASAQNPAYLATTNEVTLSAAIKAKAAALDDNPVEIFNWVRNNVIWQPTWGAVQNADLTLSAQRGNAFDISSLLIALLRASGIPARYVQGTINVPAAQFRNWAGGFQNTNAAIAYASSGGIPITGLVSGGKISTVQMEHVWVQAAVDYIPSRGVINKSADSWVPMDASFKQYSFNSGLDPASTTGVDPKKALDDYAASGTVDLQASYVAGMDSALLDSSYDNSIAGLKSYIDQNIATIQSTRIVPGQLATKVVRGKLSATLPNRVVVIGAHYAALPSSLEQSMTFALGLDALGEPSNPVTIPWPKINNQKITLQFSPATSADEQTLESYVPTAPVTDPSTLPTVIPAYLLNMVPELKVNGTTVLKGSAVTLGQNITFVFTPNFAGRQSVQKTYQVPAGSYLAVAAIAGNVSPKILDDVNARMQKTDAALKSMDETQIEALSRSQMLGDAFQAGILGYYGQYDLFSNVIGSRQGGHEYVAAGTGTLGFEPHVDYLFGVPKDVSGGGIRLNVPIFNIVGYDGTNTKARSDYHLEIGMLSSVLESAFARQVMSTMTVKSRAISAVTLLATAEAQGQKLYEITPDNAATVLPNIHLSAGPMQDINAALSAGDEVFTHTDNITVSGWTGAGYVIFNPTTGYGAYKISGGTNGALQAVFGPLNKFNMTLISWGPKGKALWDILHDTAEEGAFEGSIELTGTIIEAVNHYFKEFIAESFKDSGLCLFTDQRDALIDGLDNLDHLDWVSNVDKAADPVVKLGQLTGLIYIAANAKHLSAINSATGSCDAGG